MHMTPKKIANTQIHSRALLVWLTVHSWSARKYDRQVSNKVNADYNATSDSGRYNKFLLPGDCKSYKELTALLGTIRLQHYDHSLAWSDEGWRLLPTANYMQYTKWYRDQQKAIAVALENFLNDYSRMRDTAAVHLGKLYKSEDYPSLQDLRAKFSIDVKYSPLPAIGDVRVDLADDQIAAIESQIQESTTNAVSLAMRDAWQRLYDVVGKISERLNTPDAIFRDSLITNAKELCDSLKRLNVTNDPDLESMRVRVQENLTAFDPDILRDTPKVRRNVGAEADAILSAMSGLFEQGAA